MKQDKILSRIQEGELEGCWNLPMSIGCPIEGCGCPNVHMSDAISKKGNDNGDAWSGRGDAIEIPMWCECNHEWTLLFGEHKGTLSVGNIKIKKEEDTEKEDSWKKRFYQPKEVEEREKEEESRYEYNPEFKLGEEEESRYEYNPEFKLGEIVLYFDDKIIRQVRIGDAVQCDGEWIYRINISPEYVPKKGRLVIQVPASKLSKLE